MDSDVSTPRRLSLGRARRRTLEVPIGKVVIGGTRPIAVQSMTTTRTSDATATARQVAELARTGCDIVRVTVPSRPDSDALPEIRRLLRAEGVDVPLVADIHFTPRLALRVVEFVEKVRVNPGNFSDRKSLTGVEYGEAAWDRDVERAYEQFAPLADRARELGVALRIGVNHGSLSDRMVFRYGDSPKGMVESALEFVRFAEDRGHRGLVISMKASIPQVMVRAYRLLAERLDAEARPYPLHLGVTEAGGGDEGRMKSAAGMAVLLADGLGDTVRVSLTEPPAAEVPVGRDLVRLFSRTAEADAEPTGGIDLQETRNPLDPKRRETATVTLAGLGWGGEEVPRVEVLVSPADRRRVAEILSARPAVDLVDVEIPDLESVEAAASLLGQIPRDGGPSRAATLKPELWRRLTGGRAVDDEVLGILRGLTDRIAFVIVEPDREMDAAAAMLPGTPCAFLLEVKAPFDADGAERVRRFARRLAGSGVALMAGLRLSAGIDAIMAYRVLAAALDRAGGRVPLLLEDGGATDSEDARIGSTGRLAGLLIDGIGDAVRVSAQGRIEAAVALGHGILQAAGRRLEKAEFIACPSCGRTLFELEETTARVRELTAHLKLKIAVMGCVVNGPGEMADADFGYVGWGEGKVALFVGRELVERDIPSAEAPERLVALIRERGRWEDPEPE